MTRSTVGTKCFRACRTGALLLALNVLPMGVSRADERPAFEVASIRRNLSQSEAMGGVVGIGDGGRISMRNMRLIDLVRIAYGLRSYQLRGGPSAGSPLRFDVEARPGAEVSSEVGRLMLQRLLQERFNLQVEKTTMPVRGYVLTVAKGGVKVKWSSDVNDGLRIANRREMRGPSVSMYGLTHALAETLGSPVSDGTDLRGGYDITLTWTPEEELREGQPGVSLFVALKEQLGLELKEGKVPVDVLTIVRADRTPTEN